MSAAAATAFAIPAVLLDADPELASAEAILQGSATGFAVIALVATYVFLSLWEMAVNANLKMQRYDTAETWKIWAGWFIPFG